MGLSTIKRVANMNPKFPKRTKIALTYQSSLVPSLEAVVPEGGKEGAHRTQNIGPRGSQLHNHQTPISPKKLNG